jgi:hypothetical protein
MRNKLIAGYVSLLTGQYLAFVLNYVYEGLFFQGMALTFFTLDICEVVLEKKKKDSRKEFVKNVVTSTCITDKEKIMLLKLNSGAELRRLENHYKKEKDASKE